MPSISDYFTYHQPTGTQGTRLGLVRTAAHALAEVIEGSCPVGPDRSAAIRKLRECVMTANASIVLESL